MCGIFGYTGSQSAKKILLDGLSELNYRGYDSAGIAVNCGGKIAAVKKAGRLDRLLHAAQTLPDYSVGIAHTRWATHGSPDDGNAHPFLSPDGAFALVHNGVLENLSALQKSVEKRGLKPLSQTDSELALLLLSRKKGNPLAAILQTVGDLEGSFAFAILCRDDPHALYAVRKDSPMQIGMASDGGFLSSDLYALVGKAEKFYSLPNRTVARITPHSAEVWDFSGKRLPLLFAPLPQVVPHGGKPLETHMRSEIEEIPQAAARTLAVFQENGWFFDNLTLFARCKRIHFIGCGTAYHAALMTAKTLAERGLQVDLHPALSSEFRSNFPLCGSTSPIVAVSQSGETADTLLALRQAKKQGSPVIALCNAPLSAMASEADLVLPTAAGREIAVASTKAYVCQLLVGELLALGILRQKGLLGKRQTQQLLREYQNLPSLLRDCLTNEPKLKAIGKQLAQSRLCFYLGRGKDYVTAAEGSLKLKEISYIAGEAYAAGELKHGTLALMEKGVHTVGILTQDALFAKTLTALCEVKSRNAAITAISYRQDCEAERLTQGRLIVLPNAPKELRPILSAIPIQLLAYHAARALGQDVDKPRNLAKSVTVE